MKILTTLVVFNVNIINYNKNIENAQLKIIIIIYKVLTKRIEIVNQIVNVELDLLIFMIENKINNV